MIRQHAQNPAAPPWRPRLAMWLALSACGAPTPAPEVPVRPSSPTPTAPSSAVLASELRATGYVNLFHRADHAAVDAVWERPDASAELHRLAVDPAADRIASFLAAEILFFKGAASFSDEEARSVADAYATALAQSAVPMANPWGLPGELDGAAGQHLVALGEPAVPALAALLDDERQLIFAESQGTMLGAHYRWRVKDTAAFLLTRILQTPYQLDEDPARRDDEIRLLRARVAPARGGG